MNDGRGARWRQGLRPPRGETVTASPTVAGGVMKERSWVRFRIARPFLFARVAGLSAWLDLANTLLGRAPISMPGGYDGSRRKLSYAIATWGMSAKMPL